MIDAGINDGHNLPYEVFISKVLTLYRVVLTRETRFVCNRTNEIGKAILTCIGLKKTADDRVFKNVRNPIKSVTDSRENSTSFTPMSEFERYVVDQFKRTSERILKLDELIKNYIDSSSSTEESENDDESSEEYFMDESNSE